MGHRWVVGFCGSLLVLSIGCGSDKGAIDGGPTTVPENTSTRCQDGIDNDGDGKTDCQDPECWVLTFCLDAGVEDAPQGDGAEPDAPGDFGPLDGAADVPTSVDGPTTDTGPVSCTAHCDCPQKQFCYYGTCLTDPKMPVYCCTDASGAPKVGCPPGHWCFNPDGTKGTCAESTTHSCTDACDCGPAHCCKKAPGASTGHCVKDTEDPWDPGGTVVGSLGTCKRGADATYCCSDPLCHAGKHAYGLSAGDFRCADSLLGVTRSFCGGKSCFGTACNCDPSESCVDTTVQDPVAGKTCLLLSGGSCVSNAVAEAVYGFSPADLLPCCGTGCLPGQKCDVGWRTDGEYAYARVVGACGGPCGNGTCDPGEGAVSCPADCAAKCGDKQCFAGEETSCPSDCTKGDQCPDGWLNPRLFRRCGDGVCGVAGETCGNEPETCMTCPADCGACGWMRVQGTVPFTSTASAVWGFSATEVFVAAGDKFLRYNGSAWKPMAATCSTSSIGLWGTSASDLFTYGIFGDIAHYDGTSWTPMVSGTTEHINDMWGSSGSDVFAVGWGTILHYDGTSWSPMAAGTSQWLYEVWGSSASDVFVVGSGGTILHYDGNGWSPMASGSSAQLGAVWGSSGSDVFAAGGWDGTIRHYDGTSWTPMAAGTTASIHGLWGSSGTDVFAVGYEGAILHYDGTSWTPMASGTTVSLNKVWGSSGTDVFAVGVGGLILHYDGVSWKPMTSGSPPSLYGVWAASNSDAFAVGIGAIMNYDGASWITKPPQTNPFTLYGVWGSSASDVFAAGYHQNLALPSYPIEHTIWHYDGTSWAITTNAAFPTLNAVWGSSASDVFVVGSGGTILHYDGADWQTAPSGSTSGLYSVWGSSGSDVFVVGSGGTILRYDGASWQTAFSGGSSLYGVWGSSPSDAFAVGYSSTIRHFDGSSWTAMTAPPGSGTLEGVWGSSASDVVAVGGSGVILRYDGASWSRVPMELRDATVNGYLCARLKDVSVTKTGMGFVVGEFGTLLHRCPGGLCPNPPLPPPPTDGGVATPDAGPPLPSCGNTICEPTESCDGQAGTTACSSDCPGLTTGPPKNQYCCVGGVCIGQGCPVAGCP